MACALWLAPSTCTWVALPPSVHRRYDHPDRGIIFLLGAGTFAPVPCRLNCGGNIFQFSSVQSLSLSQLKGEAIQVVRATEQRSCIRAASSGPQLKTHIYKPPAKYLELTWPGILQLGSGVKTRPHLSPVPSWPLPHSPMDAVCIWEMRVTKRPSTLLCAT